MKYRSSRLLLIILALLALSACSNYIYTSRGNLTYASGETKTAVLYWRMDDGRLYYGPVYSEKDSGVALRICNRVPKSFNPDDTGKTEDLVLLSKSRDLQVAEIDAMGNVKMLENAIPLNPQKRDICAKFLIASNDGDSRLAVGTQPVVIFICENKIKVDRYPKADKYIFDAVTKTEYIDENSAPDACVVSQ